MSEALHIKYLAEVPHFVPTLAQWTVQAWGKYDPSLNLQSATESIEAKPNTDKVLQNSLV